MSGVVLGRGWRSGRGGGGIGGRESAMPIGKYGEGYERGWKEMSSLPQSTAKPLAKMHYIQSYRLILY